MKFFINVLFYLGLVSAFGQPDLEILLFDLQTEGAKIEVNNPKNISNNPGYDSQPFFLDDNTVLFSSTRNGQTDIARYTINYDAKTWVNFTEGSEYSPIKIPDQNAVSAIRLDSDGTQQLFRYNLSNGESELLIKDPVIGYQTWFSNNILVASILDEGALSLVAYYFDEGNYYKLQKQVGRSLHKIPGTDLVSYISKEDPEAWEIKSLDPISGATKGIMGTLPGSEDMCWLSDGTILMGHEGLIYKFKPGSDVDWSEVASLTELGVKSISRLAVNPSNDKIAMVVDQVKNTESEEEVSTVNPEQDAVSVVQEQLEAYNKRDIDAFMATYSEDIKLYRYPETLTTDGPDAMRESYKSFFDRTPDLKAVIKNRIVLGNKVIDEEEVNINGQKFRAVAIYEVKNGKINKVTFIQ